jgi:hypothetical protein
MQTIDSKIQAVRKVTAVREQHRAAGFITETAMRVGDLSSAFVDALLEWDEPHKYRSAPRMYCGI